MKKNQGLKALLFFSFLISIGSLFGQDKFTLSGTIKDAATGEDIYGARVAVLELPGTGALSNVYGFYIFHINFVNSHFT